MARDNRIPKPLAVLAAVLIVVGGAGLVTAAAMTGGETFQGLARGDPYHQERGLSRGTLTLAVIVTKVDEAGQRPYELAGANVYIAQNGRSGLERLAHATTDEDGRALFELRPGRYVVVIAHEDAMARHMVGLAKDTRIAALIDEDGQIHFHGQTRQAQRDEGRALNLFIRVGEIDNRSRAPVEGALVLIEKYEPRTETLHPAARNTTDARGGAAFYLPHGVYAVTVTTPDGAETKFRVPLDGPKSFAVLFDEDGDATVNQVRPAATRDGMTSAARERPERSE